MRFIVDLQLSPLLCDVLGRDGDEAVHALAIGLRSDDDIWAEACERSAVVVSKDSDFVRLAERTRAAQVLWVKVGNCSNADLFARLRSEWRELRDRLERGELVVELE